MGPKRLRYSRYLQHTSSFSTQCLAHCLPLDATSTEFNTDAKYPVVIFMPEISKTHMGGTMRLGLRPTVFEPGTESWSRARKLYGGAGKIWERHRHRYEVNPEYVKQLNDSGLVFSGKDEKGERMQLMELPGAFCFEIGDSQTDVSGITYLPARLKIIPSSLVYKLIQNSVHAL